MINLLRSADLYTMASLGITVRKTFPSAIKFLKVVLFLVKAFSNSLWELLIGISRSPAPYMIKIGQSTVYIYIVISMTEHTQLIPYLNSRQRVKLMIQFR
jgi:tryptophan-rich sensory protein